MVAWTAAWMVENMVAVKVERWVESKAVWMVENMVAVRVD